MPNLLLVTPEQREHAWNTRSFMVTIDLLIGPNETADEVLERLAFEGFTFEPLPVDES